MFIMDYLSSFNLYLLIQPLSVAAALSPTFGRATSGASVEASQAVLVQAVAEVHATENQQALAVIHLTLCWNNLSVK
jgi:H+/gluconate symporter-like permease